MKITDPPSLASDTTGCKARTALYFGACSRPAGADQTPEPENQSVRLREFAAAIGWTIVAEFSDQESAAGRSKAIPHNDGRRVKGEFEIITGMVVDGFAVTWYLQNPSGSQYAGSL